ncbi:MAG: hypothetical protein HY791_25600 [Deltaproteobacteria bacterium]|nr:hypothetical protein [Deltaproteobacteria bacterium]
MGNRSEIRSKLHGFQKRAFAELRTPLGSGGDSFLQAFVGVLLARIAEGAPTLSFHPAVDPAEYAAYVRWRPEEGDYLRVVDDDSEGA